MNINKEFKEKVNKTFYDTVLKNVNDTTKKYTSKLHFFFDKGEKLDLNYSDGGFRPSKFYLVHNSINPLDASKGKVTFIYKNGKWELDDNIINTNFRVDAKKIIGESDINNFFKDLLHAVRIGVAEHSKIIIKDSRARNARINSRENDSKYNNLNQRLHFEEINYFPY